MYLLLEVEHVPEEERIVDKEVTVRLTCDTDGGVHCVRVNSDFDFERHQR